MCKKYHVLIISDPCLWRVIIFQAYLPTKSDSFEITKNTGETHIHQRQLKQICRAKFNCCPSQLICCHNQPFASPSMNKKLATSATFRRGRPNFAFEHGESESMLLIFCKLRMILVYFRLFGVQSFIRGSQSYD